MSATIAPDPTSNIFRGPCTPILGFVFIFLQDYEIDCCSLFLLFHYLFCVAFFVSQKKQDSYPTVHCWEPYHGITSASPFTFTFWRTDYHKEQHNSQDQGPHNACYNKRQLNTYNRTTQIITIQQIQQNYIK
jgi:hypothetical protein